MRVRENTTIRFPEGLLASAREVKDVGQSMNDFVVQAVEREVRRRRGLQAHESIVRRREQVRARTGPHPDASRLIRGLREGTERDD